MVNVIIPTLNAEKYIQSLLKSLKEQSILCEIIVIDSSSADSTVKIAESFGAKVITIKKSEFDHGGTRNLAVNISFGDTLIFLTQDAFPADKYLIENLIKPLRNEKIAICYGRQIAKNHSNPLERFARAFNYPEKPQIKGKEQIELLGIKTFFCSNVCSAIKKSVFKEAGGFPEKAIMNEDMVLAAKLIMRGYKIAYEPSAIVYHSHNYSLWQQFKRYFDIGVFLKQERWIFELARAEEEGYKYIKEEIRYLWREKKWYWIPYVFGEAAAKYAGYRLGLIEDKLSVKLKKMISMHKDFW